MLGTLFVTPGGNYRTMHGGVNMAQDFVGTKRWVRTATPYENYMEEQNLPIHRGSVGFYDIRDLSLASAGVQKKRYHALPLE